MKFLQVRQTSCVCDPSSACYPLVINDYCFYLTVSGYTWGRVKRVDDLDEGFSYIVSNGELADLNTIQKIVDFVFFWAKFIPTKLIGTKKLDFSEKIKIL